MKLTLEIDMGGVAFRGNPRSRVAYLLTLVARDIRLFPDLTANDITDDSGDAVGSWAMR